MSCTADFLGETTPINDGEVKVASIDVIQWEATLDDGSPVCWTSEARYDEHDLYAGRTPHLTISGKAATFEDAVRIGERLGYATKWIPAESAVK